MAGKNKKKKVVFDPFKRIGRYTATAPSEPFTETCEGVVEFTDTVLGIEPALPRAEVQLHIEFRCSAPLMENDLIYIHLPGFKAAPSYFSLESVTSTEGIHFASCFDAYWSGEEKNRFGRPGKNGVPPKQAIVLRCCRALGAHTLIALNTPHALLLCCPEKLAANSAKVKIEGKVARAEGGRIRKQAFLSCTEVRKQPIAQELEGYDAFLASLVERGGLSKEERAVAEDMTTQELEQLWQSAQQRQPFRMLNLPWATAMPLMQDYNAAGDFVKAVLENVLRLVKHNDPLAIHREIAANWHVKLSAVLVLEDVLVMRCAGLYRGLARSALLAAHVLTMEPIDVARTFGVTQLPAHSILRELQSAYRAHVYIPDESNSNNNNNNESNNTGASGSQTPAEGNKGSSSVADNAANNSNSSSSTTKPEVGWRATLRKWSAVLAALLTAGMEVDERLGATLPLGPAALSKAAGRTSRRNDTNAAHKNNNGNAARQSPMSPAKGQAEGGNNAAAAAAGGDANTDNNNNNNNKQQHQESDGGRNGANETPSPAVHFADSATSEAHGSNHAVLRPPPSLYVGVRDVGLEELQQLRELREGAWYMFPSFTVAWQNCPFVLQSPSSSSDMDERGARQGSKAGANNRNGNNNGENDAESSPLGRRVTGSAANTNNSEGDAAEMSKPNSAAVPESVAAASEAGSNAAHTTAALSVPDNAVIFEVRWPVEGLELADLSAYPFNREWLLPFASSFRVLAVTVNDELNELTHVALEMVGSLAGAVPDPYILEGDRSVTTMLLRKLRMYIPGNEAKVATLAQLLYATVRRNERRRLHPPTLLRAQYLTHYQEVKWASEAAQRVESGAVTWQVCVHPAAVLEEGVVRPASWEAVPKKFAPSIEQAFLRRCRARLVSEELPGLMIDLEHYTVDYGGKGVRPMRRMVSCGVSHEAPPASEDYDELLEKLAATSKQLSALNAKLGITMGGTMDATANAVTSVQNGKAKAQTRKG